MNPQIKRQKYSIYLWNRQACGEPPDETGSYVKSIKGNKILFFKTKDFEDLKRTYLDFENHTN